jgi:hypothetical protein
VCSVGTLLCILPAESAILRNGMHFANSAPR